VECGQYKLSSDTRTVDLKRKRQSRIEETKTIGGERYEELYWRQRSLAGVWLSSDPLADTSSASTILFASLSFTLLQRYTSPVKGLCLASYISQRKKTLLGASSLRLSLNDSDLPLPASRIFLRLADSCLEFSSRYSPSDSVTARLALLRIVSETRCLARTLTRVRIVRKAQIHLHQNGECRLLRKGPRALQAHPLLRHIIQTAPIRLAMDLLLETRAQIYPLRRVMQGSTRPLGESITTGSNIPSMRLLRYP
jgi:hypothetical protein